MIRSANILAVVCIVACSSSKPSPSTGTAGGGGAGGQVQSASGATAISGAGAPSESGGSDAGVDSGAPRGPILYWQEQMGAQQWLATGAFSARGTVTTATSKTVSINIDDSAGGADLRAFADLDGTGGFSLELTDGYGLSTWDTIKLTGSRDDPNVGPFVAGQTYGPLGVPLDGGGTTGIGFNVGYTGARKTDVEAFTATVTTAITYSTLSVTLAQWDPVTRKLEASFKAVGTDYAGQTLDITGSISLTAQGNPCDTAMFACQAKFQ